MFQKKDYVFVAIIVYLFLVMMVFVTMEKDHIVVPDCTTAKPCIRFCCKDCKDSFIRESFNVTAVSAPTGVRSNLQNYEILPKPLMCKTEPITENNLKRTVSLHVRE